tara:strand:- start:3791 stop:4717 length:927 start_codon:yes stop_codon:yes gene_type:complete
MKNLLYALVLVIAFNSNSYSQENSTFYTDKDGEKHLCGPFELNLLLNDTTFSNWYKESLEDYDIQVENTPWKKALEETEVDIYLGTWCGDSKNWVPKFVKLWEELGLKQEQLHFIALYDGDEKYKQSPNGEEVGKNIHRVPTFIFKKNGEEIARIVESPANDLLTDLAHISLGYPSAPNYKGANYLMNLIAEKGLKEIKNNFKEHVNKVYRLQQSSAELNTLGYVYLRSGKIDEALMVFYMNMLCYRYNPNMYDSYAEALEVQGNDKAALQYYKIALEKEPKSEHALERIEVLEKKLAEEEQDEELEE